MKQGLVSVVLPIYNVEKYLNNCIESVVNQTYRNLEILLIDDGSPDNCPQICEEWADKDARIRVIHKENAGLGMARNTGIEHASGEYICFFDSDDYIAPDTVEKVYNRAVQEQADVVVFGLTYMDENGTPYNTFVPGVGYKTYRGAQVQEEFLPEFVGPDLKNNGKRQLYMSACLMLYSMKMIHESGWRFVSEREIISEDVYSLLALCVHLRTVTVLPEPFYYYRTNFNSLSRKYVPNRYARIRHFYMESIALCKSLGYSTEVLHRLTQPYLSFTVAAMKQAAVADSLTRRERKQEVQTIVEDELLQQTLAQVQGDKWNTGSRILFRFMGCKQHAIIFLLLEAKARL